MFITFSNIYLQILDIAKYESSSEHTAVRVHCFGESVSSGRFSGGGSVTVVEDKTRGI